MVLGPNAAHRHVRWVNGFHRESGLESINEAINVDDQRGDGDLFRNGNGHADADGETEVKSWDHIVSEMTAP
jgi:hypothetical protein